MNNSPFLDRPLRSQTEAARDIARRQWRESVARLRVIRANRIYEPGHDPLFEADPKAMALRPCDREPLNVAQLLRRAHDFTPGRRRWHRGFWSVRGKSAGLCALAAIALAAILLAGCTDPDGARKALEDAGLTPIAVGGYSWACGRDDDYATRFKAQNAKGKFVAGTVCSGAFFKGKTIRYD